MLNRPRFADIPFYTTDGHYRIDVQLCDVEHHVRRWQDDHGLEINPDFQRGHVWTEAHRERFVEHMLRKGQGSNELRFNHPGWMGSWKGQMVLVDGLQRLTAVREFLGGRTKAFGYYIDEYEDVHDPLLTMSWRVNDLPTREAVLRWYLEINAGAVAHTADELAKVESLLEAEVNKTG